MRKLGFLFRYWDLTLFATYSALLVIFSHTLATPVVGSTNKIGLLFVAAGLGLIFGIFTARLFANTKSFQGISATLKSSRLLPACDRIGLVLLFLTLAIFFAVGVSWGAAIQKHIVLLEESFSVGLRAITTNLHALVPLESRLFHTIIPLVLFLPSSRGSHFDRAKPILLAILLVVAFAMQNKFVFLYAPIMVTAFLWSRGLLMPFTKKSLVAILLVAGFSTSNLVLIQKSGNPIAEVVKRAELPTVQSTAQSAVGSLESSPTKCSFDGAYPQWAFESAPGLLTFRAFGLSAAVMRLFVCLREAGWSGSYQGHQLARIFGVYIPYYKMAYAEFRPGHGSLLNSAVTNVVPDSYFNAGWTGVVAAGFLIGLITFIIEFLTRSSSFAPVAQICRLNALIVLVSGSLPSAMISMAPTLFLFGLAYFYERRILRQDRQTKTA